MKKITEIMMVLCLALCARAAVVTNGLQLRYEPGNIVLNGGNPNLAVGWNNTGAAGADGNTNTRVGDPTVVTNAVNGYPALSFAVSQGLIRQDNAALSVLFDNTECLTFMQVYKVEAGTPNRYPLMIDYSESTNPLDMGVGSTGGDDLFAQTRNATYGGLLTSIADATTIPGDWMIIAATWDGVSDTFQVCKNGLASTLGTGASGAFTSFVSFSISRPDSYSAKGMIADTLVYNRVLSESELTSNFIALGSRYNIEVQQNDGSRADTVDDPSKYVQSDAKPATKNWKYELHKKVSEIQIDRPGPFERLPSGELVAISETSCMISKDNGQSWEAYPMFSDPEKFTPRWEHSLVVTGNGTLIVAFSNAKEVTAFNWQEEISDAPGYKTPTYTVRSCDGGRTWDAPVKLHDEWTGANRQMIQMRNGSIVLSTMMAAHNPGRHTVVTYTSRDEGQTWIRSNRIDIGGVGHHSGAIEATLTELQDERLWMLIRTNWGQFWEAFSNDDGLSWGWLQASNIPASAAPGILKRLQSGRLVLVWNRPGPSDWKADGVFGDVSGMSNHRDAFSMMFSEDDGLSWTEPVEIVRCEPLPKQVAYPQIFEARPGELWVSSTWPHCQLVMRVFEKDFTGTEVKRIRFDRKKRNSPLPVQHAAIQSARKIVAFGDSTTAPRNVDGQSVAIYSTLLSSGMSVVNKGVGGNTTKDAMSRFERDVMQEKPDTVVMQFGINDSMVDVWKTPPISGSRVPLAEYRSNLESMIRTMKGAGIRVILMTPNPLAWTPELKRLYGREPYVVSDPMGLNVKLTSYAEAVREIANAEGVKLVDVYGAFLTYGKSPDREISDLLLDGMHPNDRGHRLVAGLLNPVLAGSRTP